MLRQTAIVILAAGGSRRLGRPKQLLSVLGEPLLRRVVRMAVDVDPDHLIVVLGSSAYDCVPVIKDCGVDIVVNPFWESGLAGSIRLGVERAEEQGASSVLFLLADQPWLNSEVIGRFLERINGQTDAIISARYDGILGAPMMFGSDWFPQLKNLEGDQGARNLVAKEGGRVEVIDWSEGALDLDTPEDLDTLMTGLESMHRSLADSRKNGFGDER
jgi:CTP:molybdopterin cytidylyltransferase MocA